MFISPSKYLQKSGSVYKPPPTNYQPMGLYKGEKLSTEINAPSQMF